MNDIIYLDNAATTYPKPEVVYEFMDEFYREFGFNIDRGSNPKTTSAKSIVKETRDLLKELLGCSNNHEVVFSHSATEATNVILQGLDWVKIKNVYITHFEHNAVLRTLHYMKQKYSFDIYYIDVDKEALEYNLESIKYDFQDNKPDLLIMTHASNVCGLITPIAKISKLAEDYKPTIIVDAAQTAGLLDIRVDEWNIDYLIFAGHKTLYGPFGIAGFTMRTKLDLKPLIYGGTGVDSANIEMPESIPKRYEAGSHNIYAIAGLNRSLKWINEIGRENIFKHELELKEELIGLLDMIDGINVIKTRKTENQIGVVSCTFDEYSSDQIGQVLADNNVAVRSGLHCAPGGHKYLGTYPDGTLRFSVSYFNDCSELIELENVLKVL